MQGQKNKRKKSNKNTIGTGFQKLFPGYGRAQQEESLSPLPVSSGYGLAEAESFRTPGTTSTQDEQPLIELPLNPAFPENCNDNLK